MLDLRAAPLEGRSLDEALAALVESLVDVSGTGPAIHLEADLADAPPLPARIELGLYRIAQEALANALRHAQAGRIDLQLTTEPERVSLTVRDDGRGFDPRRLPPGSFGLVGMSERARLLGGRFDLASRKGRGTRVRVQLPLGEPETGA